MAVETSPPAAPAAAPMAPLRWWREVLYTALFYGVYTAVRNQFGSDAVSPEYAYDNAMKIIDWQLAIGLYHEETLQDWFLPYEGFVRLWNVYYGTAHFIVTFGVLIWCFRRLPSQYRLWRTTFMGCTGLAIIGFTLFPLMPPRLLDAGPPWGGGAVAEARGQTWGYVDTLDEIGGLWSFNDSGMASISNQYAAMPSLHIGWSTWSAVVAWRLTKRRWARALWVLYPLATLFCIVVTANHFWLDGIGGLISLTAGFLVAKALLGLFKRQLGGDLTGRVLPNDPPLATDP
jgi:hypothetical protein